MKRIILAAVLCLAVIVAAVPAFAVTASQQGDSNWLEQRMSWFEQKINWKKANVDRMVEDGTITAEQGQVWKNHFDEMLQFHQKNGFLCPGGPGNGQGRMNGQGGPGMGMRGGFGMGPGAQQQMAAPQNL